MYLGSFFCSFVFTEADQFAKIEKILYQVEVKKVYIVHLYRIDAK